MNGIIIIQSLNGAKQKVLTRYIQTKDHNYLLKGPSVYFFRKQKIEKNNPLKSTYPVQTTESVSIRPSATLNAHKGTDQCGFQLSELEFPR